VIGSAAYFPLSGEILEPFAGRLIRRFNMLKVKRGIHRLSAPIQQDQIEMYNTELCEPCEAHHLRQTPWVGGGILFLISYISQVEFFDIKEKHHSLMNGQHSVTCKKSPGLVLRVPLILNTCCPMKNEKWKEKKKEMSNLSNVFIFSV
jgi:hypothetical protein